MTGRVGPVGRALGFAGLLPQIATVAVITINRRGTYDLPIVAAYLYASLILSFLGGIWWGFAMRREGGQGVLVAMAVLPSLAPFAIAPFAVMSWSLPLALLGAALMLTLLVDGHLVATGEAPDGWMNLRAPLSLGLGTLTIVAGLLSR